MSKKAQKMIKIERFLKKRKIRKECDCNTHLNQSMVEIETLRAKQINFLQKISPRLYSIADKQIKLRRKICL